MQSRKPSPSLVVSIIALVVALSGTAVAAQVLITSTSQIKDGTIRSVDIKSGTITKKQLSKNTVRSFTAGAGGGASSGSTQALEVHRKTGPDMPKGGPAVVAELSLSPGVYAVFAKATLTPFIPDRGLLDVLLKENKTVAAECTLDVNGTGDFALSAIATPSSVHPATVNTQLTRTLDTPGKAVLTCEADKVHWAASDSSIIALKVGSTSRTEAP